MNLDISAFKNLAVMCQHLTLCVNSSCVIVVTAFMCRLLNNMCRRSGVHRRSNREMPFGEQSATIGDVMEKESHKGGHGDGVFE